MKKIIFLLLCLIPFVKVDAISCLGFENSNEKQPLVLEEINNFKCSGIEGDTLTFKNTVGDTVNDLKDYFKYNINDKEATIDIVNKKLTFDSNFQTGIVVISDGKSSFSMYIKNNAYVKQTTTTTTTTKNPNEITYTVTLDNKGNKDEKTCTVSNEGDICYVTLPVLETEGFDGWGKASTCKEGNTGSTKVNENITYYACYKNNEEAQVKTDIYLKSLKIYDQSSKEIKFGTFSIKKREYEFKVLYEVENITIDATTNDEGINIEYSGNENLVVGENEVIITLTDESNNKSEYKLIVNRLEEGETINNINYLSALVIGNYKINFNKDVFNYNLTIDSDIEKLEINAVPSDEENVVEITNNKDLVDGSVIKINVTNDNGNVTTYKINITKESNNLLLFIGIGMIILLIIVLIILIIVKTNQKKKLEKTKNNSKPETINNDVEVLKL